MIRKDPSEHPTEARRLAMPSAGQSTISGAQHWLAILGLFLLWLCGLLSDTSWFFACAAAWALHAGFLALLMACWRPQLRLLLACVLLYGLLGWQRWQVPAPLPADPDQAAPELSLCLANQGFWNAAPELIHTLQAQTVDLVILIEAHPAVVAALRPHWPHVEKAGQAHTPYAWACLSRWPIRQQVTPIPAADRGQLGALILDHPAGQIALTVLHPASPLGGHRHHEQRRIFQQAADIPADLLAGDCNACPEYPAFRRLLAQTGLALASSTVVGTWPASWGPLGIPIDHVCCRPTWQVINSETIALPGSDHRGRLLTLRMTAADDP